MAEDVRQALHKADEIRKELGKDYIRSNDLLAGALEVKRSSIVGHILEQYDFSELLGERDRSPKTIKRELLLVAGKTRISVAVTEKPWQLPVDAFTVPTDQSLSIGYLGKAFTEDALDGSLEVIQQLFGTVTTIDEQNPLLIKLPDNLAENQTARKFFVATAYKPDGTIAPESAVEAMSAIVSNALEFGIHRLTFPILGTGKGGLNFKDAIERLESLLPDAGRIVQKQDRQLNELIITVINNTEKDVLVGLARQIRWNEMEIAPREIITWAARNRDPWQLPDEDEPLQIKEVVRAVLSRDMDSLSQILRNALLMEVAKSESDNDIIRTMIADVWEGPVDHLLGSMPSLAEPVVEVLEFAANHGPPGRVKIAYHDLVASLFLTLEPGRSPPGAAYLEKYGFVVPNFGDQFIEFIESTHANETEYWRYAVRRGELTLPSFVSYDNDEIRKEIRPEDDKLNVLPDAERFAGLLAAAKVKPPIAVGLFGDWGTGKTFFMRLLQNRIETLVAGADDSRNHDYVARVVQIEFNAWHYADSNLWACLAMRIFDELAKAFGANNESEVARIRKTIHEEIASNKRRKSQVEQQKSAAENERKEKSKSLAEKQEEGARKRKELSWGRLKRAVEKTLASDEFRSDKETIQNAADRLGLSTALRGYDDLQQLRGEFEAVWNSARINTALIFNRFTTTRKAIISLIVMLLAVFIVDWIGIAYEQLLLQKPQISAFFSELSVTLVQIGALATAAAGWLGRNLKVVSQAVGKLEVLRENVANEQAVAEPDDEEKEIQEQIDELDVEIQQLSDEVVAADRSLERAEAELERINSGGLVYDFLMARRQNSLYLNELGLISTIRADFESLKDLLEDMEQHAEDRAVRIILYIDDLDRCQPDRVVEVLQAVHLLLAMDLFSVVVGVDARWLERSLYREYVGKENLASQPESNRPAEVFSPQNYLEKIFQIPFTLPGMTETCFADLVDQLVTTRSEAGKEAEHAKPEPEGEGEAEQKEAPSGEEQSDASTRTKEKAEDGESKTLGPDEKKSEKTEQTDEKATADNGTTPSPEEKDEGKAQQDRMREQIEALDLEKWEEAFISKLHGFVQTPRLLKRLVNVYRLIRMKASTEGDFFKFMGNDNGGEYRAVLILLALNMGTPDVGRRILHMLSYDPVESSWENFIDQVQLAQTQPERQDWYGNWFKENPWPKTVQTEMVDVAQNISRLRNDVGLPDHMDFYTKWARDVGPYSFHWHQIPLT